MEILIVLAIVMPVCLVFVWLSFKAMREFYHEQFKGLAIIVKEAMAQRDAEVMKYKALFTQDLIRDGGGAFDTALEDLSDLEEVLEEEIANESEEDSTETDQ